MTPKEISRRTVSRVRYYLLWDCSSCGVLGINAHTCKQCFSCGNPKETEDAAEREYRSSTPVNDNYQHAGADITCQSCGTDNVRRFSCRNCGSALDERFSKQVSTFTHTRDVDWKKRKVLVDQPVAEESSPIKEVPDQYPPPVVLEEPERKPAVEKSSLPSTKREAKASAKAPNVRNSRMLMIGLLVAFCVAVVGYFVYQRLNDLRQTVVEATAVSWTYSLPREDYAARMRSYETENFAWRPPASAFAVTQRPTIVRYEPVYESVWVQKTCSRYEDSSYNDTDGTWVSQTDLVTYDCSKSETRLVGQDPVQGTHWAWREMAWAPTTPLTASGNDHNVAFPPFVPTATLRASGKAREVYTVTFSYQKENGATTSADRDYPRSVWDTVTVNQRYAGVVDGFNRLRAVETLDSDYLTLKDRAR